MRSSLMGGVSRFAHLSGIALGVSRGARAEDDDSREEPKGKKSRAAEEDDDEPKGRRSSRAEDDDKDEPKGKKSRASDDDDEGEPQGKKSRRAADDDDDEDEPKGKKSRASDDDDDEDEPKGRRSRASDDDDDDDDKNEMNGRSAAASARRRERDRCAAIFGSRHAEGNVALAASLAFDTTMTRKEAVAVLKSQSGRAAPATSAHDVRADRRDRNPRLGPGGEESPTGAQASEALWARTLAKIGVPGAAK